MPKLRIISAETSSLTASRVAISLLIALLATPLPALAQDNSLPRTGALADAERPITFELTVRSDMATQLHEGAYVDVFWTDVTSVGAVTKLIEEHLLVEAYDNSLLPIDQSELVTKDITLRTVRKEQILRIAMGNVTGRLSVALSHDQTPD